jgi:hypothetical protein
MWVCPACGNRNREDGKYCDNCAEPRPGPEPVTDFTISMPEPRDPKGKIAEAIKKRKSTDLKVSNLWVSLALFGFLATGGIYFLLAITTIFRISMNGTDLVYFSMISVYQLAKFLFGVLFAVLAFKLIDRLNRHNDREERLRAAVMAFLRAQPSPQGKEPEIMDQLLSVSAFDGQALVFEKKLDARRWGYGVGWVIIVGGLSGLATEAMTQQVFNGSFDLWPLELVLSLLGSILSLVALIMLLIIAGHLMKTIYTHGIRWHGFASTTAVALRKLGYKIDPPTESHPIPDRSLALYAILTIVTLGLFGFYWLYTLINDPNMHFEDQWTFENRLLDALRI